jgi:hypothetical protein
MDRVRQIFDAAARVPLARRFRARTDLTEH